MLFSTPTLFNILKLQKDQCLFRKFRVFEKMSGNIKCFKNIMKVEEIRGQRILTSFLPPQEKRRVEIFVKNIPQHLDEDTIVPFLEIVGPVHTLRLMLDKNNLSNRGFAYVTYLDSDKAQTATKVLNGKEIIPNCPLKITESMNNCRIFLGGIPVTRTKDEVWQELTKRGITNIVDVIMYRSYNNRAENRGFVFVEFPSHQYAAKMRNKMKGMALWNNEVIVDWSVPEPVVPEEEMQKVKILYIRNLNVMESRECLKAIIELYIRPEFIEKLYKFKNYAFVHLVTRQAAMQLLAALTDHYKGTPVQVSLSKPPSEYTKPQFRKQMLSKNTKEEEALRVKRILDTAISQRDSFERKADLHFIPSPHSSVTANEPGMDQKWSLEEALKSLEIHTSRMQGKFTSSTPVYPVRRVSRLDDIFSSIKEGDMMNKENLGATQRIRSFEPPTSVQQKVAKSSVHRTEVPNENYTWPSYPCSWGDILGETREPLSSLDNFPGYNRTKLTSRRLFLDSDDEEPSKLFRE